MRKPTLAWTGPLARRSWLLGLLGLPLLPARTSEPLYMPRSIQRAYARGTHTLDGRPGPAYWENHGRYRITLTATPPDRTIRGSEQITYLNNSPDTLPGLVIQLFQNNHKPGAPRMGGAPPEALTSGLHVDGFSVNGVPHPWQESSRYFTWQPVRLPAPLLPGDSVRLTFDWHYEIVARPGREGMIDPTTYYLAYFYPRVAVYDDTNGWNTMDFTGEQEFYSDFNDFDVTVRVPGRFLVWGTGTLQNPADVLQPEPLRRFQASLTSDSTIHVAAGADVKAGRVTTPDSMHAWHFTADYVPDVAFGVSDHYGWDAASVLVDDAAGRRAGVQAAYSDTAPDFHQMVRFGRHALDFLSHEWPGVPYPYAKTTIFQGGAGMEYPMMVNDESYEDSTFSRFVAEHEIAHTYFPFYMGVDETRYGFMDEGWATTLEYLMLQADVGPDRATDFFKRFRVTGWIHDPSPLEDLPIITPEDVLKGVAYGSNAYGKPALGYLAMKDLLGDALFKQCLQAYIDRWHGKHPIPWDFFYTFDDVSGKDLNWFWRAWYFEPSYIDLAVMGVTPAEGGYTLTLANVGGMPAPVDLRLTYGDGTVETVHETPAIWESDLDTTAVPLRTDRTLTAVALEHGIWMDADTTNDRWTGGSQVGGGS